MPENYICALDIGSSKIAAAVAAIKKNRILNIFFESQPAKGIKRGLIVDSISLVSCITEALKALKAKSGIKIKFINTNISGSDIITKHSQALIPLAERGNKVITAHDIEKVNDQARLLGSSLEEEIIHQIPFGYTIDSKGGIANPLGLYSHRLGLDLYLVCAKTSSVQTLTRVINQAGYEIKNLFFSGLATSKVVFDQELKKGVVIFCDIGSDITELLIFRDGALGDIDIVSEGGDDLTMQLSEALKIPFELAEDVKRSHGVIGDFNQAEEDKEILIKKNNIYKPIKQREVSAILTSKTKLACTAIKEAVEKKVAIHSVDHFLVAGRTLLLDGFLEALEGALGIPVKIGRITNPDIVPFANKSDELRAQRYLTYLTSLGIVSSVLRDKHSVSLPCGPLVKNPFLRAINKVKTVYQEYF